MRRPIGLYMLGLTLKNNIFIVIFVIIDVD